MAGDTVLALGALIDAQGVVSALEGDLAGVEGETALALVEAGLSAGELEASSLPLSIAAYREALAFGKREMAQKLQAHIVDEIRRQSQQLNRFLGRFHPSAGRTKGTSRRFSQQPRAPLFLDSSRADKGLRLSGPTGKTPPPIHSTEALALVNRFFPPDSEERGWFNIEWDQLHEPQSPKDRWEELRTVIRERLHTAATWADLVDYLKDHQEEAQALAQIERDQAKASALFGLIRELQARGKLTLQPDEEGMVRKVERTFTSPS